MTIKDYVHNRKISVKNLVMITGLPESEVEAILVGSIDLRYCKAKTACKLAAALDVKPEWLINLEPIVQDMPSAAPSVARHLHPYDDPESFKKFRKNIIEVKNKLSPVKFIESLLDERVVKREYEKGNYANALFAIGLADYIVDENQDYRITRYDGLRGEMMLNPVFPFGETDSHIDTNSYRDDAIQQLLKFNFIETPETIRIA